MAQADVVIVGAGLAGLACARALVAAGRSPVVFEAADAPGGRVRTDVIDGFRFDRGFQVLLTAYPEAQAVLDYPSLQLRTFAPGARVWSGGRMQTVGDPLRRPGDAWPTLRADVGSVWDKLRILKWRVGVGGDPAALLARPDRTLVDTLRDEYGFSDRMIDHFFRPFLGGVFLDRDLGVSRRMGDYVWRMFSAGDVAIPALGIGAIPEQLCAALPPGTVRLGHSVQSVESGRVTLTTGETWTADAVVVATDMHQAARWLPQVVTDRGWNSATCMYFLAPESPVGAPLLVLNGENSGPVNNVHVVTDVTPAAAPNGQVLVSATIVATGGRPVDTTAVRAQLRSWFGAAAERWELVHQVPIPWAQPRQIPGDLEPAERPVVVASGLYVCGDHRDQSSIQGALRSGRRAAEAIIGSSAPR